MKACICPNHNNCAYVASAIDGNEKCVAVAHARSKSEFVGADGSPCGWFSVGFRSDSDEFELAAFPTFCDLLNHYTAANLILVDIPIGLPDGRTQRRCDIQAKRRLCPHCARVFRTPTRNTVAQVAKHPDDYETAKNIEHENAGQKLTKQAFYITHKIAQVNNLLPREVPPRIREVHPEVCYWALNNNSPVELSKKKTAGREERIRILEHSGAEPKAKYIVDVAARKLRSECVAKDDILDALVAAVTARKDQDCDLPSLPEPPRHDENALLIIDDQKPLRMEMVFWQTEIAIADQPRS